VSSAVSSGINEVARALTEEAVKCESPTPSGSSSSTASSIEAAVRQLADSLVQVRKYIRQNLVYSQKVLFILTKSQIYQILALPFAL